MTHFECWLGDRHAPGRDERADLRHHRSQVEDIETTTPLELALGTGLELLLEFSTKYITLGPLYSLTQPLAVLKTRAFYRMVQVSILFARSPA